MFVIGNAGYDPAIASKPGQPSFIGQGIVGYPGVPTAEVDPAFVEFSQRFVVELRWFIIVIILVECGVWCCCGLRHHISY